MKKSSPLTNMLLLILGIGLYLLVTWKWNVPAAAWLAPIFLMGYFRAQKRWITTLPAAALLWAASYANKSGAWGMDPSMEVVLLGLAAIPMIFALYLDRYTSKRLSGLWSTLVFPAAFVSLDYAVSFLPIGTTFSISPTQFYIEPLVQVATLTGIWGIEFLLLWAAPVVNAVWENGFDLREIRLPAAVYSISLIVVLLYGGLRVVVTRPESTTARVAGITVAHARNYWDELLDKGTPEELVSVYAPEMKELEEQLFLESENAVRSGAKVIFWSEGDAFILPGEKDAFMERARNFAVQHQVYLMPAYLVMRYGDTSGFNGLAMFTPQGEMANEYEKTMSWYATTSDGILHSVDTPYGRIGAVVCFDLDFPGLIRQAAQQDVDILLVPSFDTYETRVYHTEVGLLRAIEFGFSVFRMVNEGTSMAVDVRGRVLGSQEFFTTPSRILVIDVPTQGVTTLYGKLGDWFAWLCIVLMAAGVFTAVFRRAATYPENSRSD